jgi:hypothetical protein
MRRWVGVLVLVVPLVSWMIQGGAAGADPALSLESEVLAATKSLSQATPSCDATGTSSVSFSVSGVAIGPYPGTYTESGTITIGPQNDGPGTFGIPFPTGPVLSFSASFSITSPVGNVQGTKTFDAVLGGSGNCVTPTPGNLFDQICGGADNSSIVQYEAVTQSDYSATITTPTGDFHDSGLALFQLQGIQGSCGTIGFGDGLQRSGEQFELSNGVVPLITPGKATGGGAIDGATFGFNALSDTQGLKGNCEVMVGTHVVHCLDVTTYTQSDNRATFSGNALVDGAPARYTIDVTDNGEPGVGHDTFSIVTSTGISASGVLTAGNIQVHKT